MLHMHNNLTTEKHLIWIFALICVMTVSGDRGLIRTNLISLDPCSSNHKLFTFDFVSGCEMAPSSKMWESNYRIPESTLPLHYDLYLFPDLDQKTFSGHVTIHIKATEPRDYLVTHVQYLKVTKTELKDADQNVVPLDSSFEYEPNQFWVVVPSSKPLQAGNYSLYLEFNGRLDRDILGFYMSSYTDNNGGNHKIASSKFQPTYARRVRLLKFFSERYLIIY